MKTLLLIVIIYIVLRKVKQQKQPGDTANKPDEHQAEKPEIYNLCSKCGSLVNKNDWKCKSCGKLQRVPLSLFIAVLTLILGIVVALWDHGYLNSIVSFLGVL